MQVEKKLFCHWDLVRFVTEKHLLKEDGTTLTLSVTDGDKREHARNFTDLLGCVHPEFRKRLVQEIK